MGLHQAVADCIERCHAATMRAEHTWFRTVVLAGGTACLPGLPERLEKEVYDLLPPSISNGICVITSPYGADSAWYGAKLLINLSTFPNSWCITEETQSKSKRSLICFKSETQELLFQELVCLFRSYNGDIQNAARIALLQIKISRSMVQHMLDYVLEKSSPSTSTLHGKKKKKWDSHSKKVFEDLISIIVPCWLSRTENPEEVLQVFLYILPDVTEHRRLSIIVHLLSTLGESGSLDSLQKDLGQFSAIYESCFPVVTKEWEKLETFGVGVATYELGVETVPVFVGPVSYLLLSKRVTDSNSSSIPYPAKTLLLLNTR
ncbi:unnamed protein product [Lactuca virosa]|uniref:Utp10/HEAT1 HEAT-repeats domain-containing protein n=1 Tax=Lactuca virosa TaxID=75947 RepID=A0AAU9PDC5_9ASTR|nr:unnamed protein product [Lactuca virosa]